MSRFEGQASGEALSRVSIDTSWGEFTAHFSVEGLAELDFPGQARRTSRSRSVSTDSNRGLREWTALTRDALWAILNGDAPDAMPPLDVRAGTHFQRQVWQALRHIPVGQTRSYGEIAAEIGSPSATRAVGTACGANPIPVLIPCHRVLAAHARLGGFSAGLDWKRRLLAAEGVMGFELNLPFK
jgi:AraC family transcriptional regulator, regulatory protein of adaptative response / methylated-DNA-[protein]-cysteine methyltransferase